MSSPRLSLLAGLLALSLPHPSRAQTKSLPTFTDADAAAHAGAEATVTGKVTAVTKSKGGTSYLNFGDRFPRQTFSGVVLVRDQEKVGDLKAYEGQSVTISGKIELSPDQKPQIVISKPEQIKLAEPGAPAPAAPAGEKPPATSAPMPAAPAPAAPNAALPKSANARKIVLAQNWASAPQTGAMTRKDLAMLFSGQGTAADASAADASILVYQDIPFLTPLAEARKRLKLDSSTPSKAKVTCPGLPFDSFSAYAFSGVFEGGYNRLYLVTDNADQLVSALVVDENSRQRTRELDDSFGYHTYNFINNRVKGTNDLIIRHEIATATRPGVVTVESTLIDPNDGAPASSSRPSPRPSSTAKATTRTSRDGKVLERSRWFVPVPVVHLILRSLGSR